MFKALLYAYVLGGLTFIPLIALAFLFIAIYTSVPVGDPDVTKAARKKLESKSTDDSVVDADGRTSDINDLPKSRKGWLTMRRTFEEPSGEGGYVNLVRTYLDSRSKDPKKSKPKDMWFVVLKGKVLYLYEDEEMTECEAVVELGSHEVVIFPEGQSDGELFAKRNCICLKPKDASQKIILTVTKELKLQEQDIEGVLDSSDLSGKQRERQKDRLVEAEKRREEKRDKELSSPAPWFIFVRSNFEMEDWYFALIHASDHPAQTLTLAPLEQVFQTADMNHLLSTLDEQPDVIPMRWLNALIGRIFFSFYRTQKLEEYVIGRIMKKLSKVKRPAFLADIVVTEVSLGNRPPMLSKPMLKELTKEGDASLEVHLQYKGEIRITIEATAIIQLGQFRSYTVKLALAAVLKELEGNLLIRVKRPPSNRIWYAFTQSPRMVLEVEPIVSDRQIKWGMILSTIESKLKEIIQESVVMPNMDDIAFFESSAYNHRGGIWSDASRSEHPASVSSPTPSAEETLSTVSAPVLSPDTEVTSSIPLGKSISTSNVSESEPPRPASVIPVIQAQGNSQGPANEDRDQSDAQTISQPILVRDGEQFGYVSTTPPQQPSGEQVPEILEPSEDSNNDYASDDNYSSHSRRSSIYSTKSHKSHKSIDSALDSSDTTSHKSLDPAQRGTSSFLSTLKSKAGDKQALSNTARETIRKWGVNWGNLKKEFANSSSEENGDLTSRLRSMVENSVSNKGTTYADVRAAVEERKRNGHSEEEGDLNRSTSSVGSQKDGQSSSNPPKEQGTPNNTSSPARTISKTMTPTLTPTKSPPSVSRVNIDIDATDDISDDDIRPAPIQAQPQAKTMTIPGIHASHRNEVMSMGFVAPQPSMLVDSLKSKNPGIQSVYRLWRSPGGTGQEPDVSVIPAKIPTPNTTETDPPQFLSPSLHAARQAPPPLPPRSPPSTRIKDSPVTEEISLSQSPSTKPERDTAMLGLSDDSIPLLSNETRGTTVSSLKVTPPPLPPRRIPSAV